MRMPAQFLHFGDELFARHDVEAVVHRALRADAVCGICGSLELSVYGRPRPRNMASRTLVPRIEPLRGLATLGLHRSLAPLGDASGLASSFGPARFACRLVNAQG